MPLNDIIGYLKRLLKEREGIELQVDMDGPVKELGVYWYRHRSKNGSKEATILLDCSLSLPILIIVLIHECLEIGLISRMKIHSKEEIMFGEYHGNPREAIIDWAVGRLLWPGIQPDRRLANEPDPFNRPYTDYGFSASSEAMSQSHGIPKYYLTLFKLSNYIQGVIEKSDSTKDISFLEFQIRKSGSKSTKNQYGIVPEMDRIVVMNRNGKCQYDRISYRDANIYGTELRFNKYKRRAEPLIILLDYDEIKYTKEILAFIVSFFALSTYPKQSKIELLSSGTMTCRLRTGKKLDPETEKAWESNIEYAMARILDNAVEYSRLGRSSRTEQDDRGDSDFSLTIRY